MSQKLAIVFPGQGSQSVGMMAELYQEHAVVRDAYAEASDVLDFDLWALTLNGPAELLNQTVNTQPAMLVAGVAVYRVLQAQVDVVPACFAGHSLGEYSALVASEQLAFADAIRLARKRAHAMQAAVPEGIGAMAAILGLKADLIRQTCADVSTEAAGAWAANDNAPGQVVIAGHKEAVEKACESLKALGAKRALMLPVSVPSHCPLMQPAADDMKEAFMLAKWSTASAPVIHNYDVSAHTDIGDIVTALTEQLVKPVRWVETVEYFAQQGIDTVIEVGPGKVLTGLNKRIEKNIQAKAVYDSASLADVAEVLHHA